MVSLAQFREEIKAAEKPTGQYGYRMDGKGPKDMRHHAGLDGCHCCDYFITNEESFVLIEETQLSKTIQCHKDKYQRLSATRLHALTIDLIRNENRLKAYGTLLILCRLAAKHPEFAKITQAKNYHFWLVIDGVPSADRILLLNLATKLTDALSSVLGKGKKEINIVPSDALERKISECALT